MAYQIKDVFGNVKAEVLDDSDWEEIVKAINERVDVNTFKKELNKINLRIDNFTNNLKLLNEFQEAFLEKEKRLLELKDKLEKEISSIQKIKKKKQKIIDDEIEDFYSTIKNTLENFKIETQEIIKQGETFKQEQKEAQQKLIKDLNSEYLKKVAKEIKPEDVNVLKILKGFCDRTENINKTNAEKLFEDIRETIPKLSLSSQSKYKILQIIDSSENELKEKENATEKSLFILSNLKEVLKDIINQLQAGFEINDIKISKAMPKQKKEEKPEGNYYGN